MKTIRTEEFPVDLRAAEFFESLDVSEGEIVIESHGEPKVVLISAADLRQRREAKERLFQMIDNIRQTDQSLNSDEILQELEEADRKES